MKVVSEPLGHSGIAITSDVYSHVTAATDHAAAVQLRQRSTAEVANALANNPCKVRADESR
jgi:hypothetical protein